MPPTLLWLRRDLRLSDHKALTAAIAAGGPVIPVFILDDLAEGLGAAPKWRLGEALRQFDSRLQEVGSRLILRRGPALTVLRALVAETGAKAIHWSRLYDPEAIARDTGVKTWAGEAGIEARSHTGHVLFEPWTVSTGSGGYYQVYSPFWRAVRARDPGALQPAPSKIPAPDIWPASDRLEDWRMGAAMLRGADVVSRFARIGDMAAEARLEAFLGGAAMRYKQDRDRPGLDATSRLSENLTYGEISPRRIWHAARAMLETDDIGIGVGAGAEARNGVEHFLKELVWRDFAWHLCYHTPHILTQSWKTDWDRFDWSMDDAPRWRMGMTGEPMIDAAMRELYVTGTMHNRARMLVASYLTKYLLRHWKLGQAWFADCLIDWDPASNAMGWQWAAGSGPDAAPYFRVFNPRLQGEKFDADGAYRQRFLAGHGSGPAHPDALAFFDAIPRAWGLDPDTAYPAPMIDPPEGRARALHALAAFKDQPAV